MVSHRDVISQLVRTKLTTLSTIDLFKVSSLFGFQPRLRHNCWFLYRLMQALFVTFSLKLLQQALPPHAVSSLTPWTLRFLSRLKLWKKLVFSSQPAYSVLPLWMLFVLLPLPHTLLAMVPAPKISRSPLLVAIAELPSCPSIAKPSLPLTWVMKC